MICGDAIIDLDLGAALHEHRSKGAIVSVVTLEVPPEEVQNYGIVVADQPFAGRYQQGQVVAGL
ncbi:sugar phosphate nucleotidyltransferase [Propionivibrio sp.]|uniref:sugar phosphate nucleotidyltransferase n=1 Tax=Propionivibrio sp. TaxID=2212460 RepID=UPI003BF05683